MNIEFKNANIKFFYGYSIDSIEGEMNEFLKKKGNEENRLFDMNVFKDMEDESIISTIVYAKRN